MAILNFYNFVPMQSQVRFTSRLVAVLIGLVSYSSSKAQLTTSLAYTPQQLVQNVLLGQGIQAFNITYTGYANAIGKFYSVNTGLGIDSGVVMTTGSVIANDPNGFGNLGPMGPNSSASDGVGNNLPGDPDLDVIGNTNTNDAAVLEFDFIPLSDSVKFRYVFGSEEYDDFVGSINDVFAFILSGVSVPLAPTNLALIPSTTTPVTINNVNNGQAFGTNPATGPCTNCAYFHDNPMTTGSYPLLQYDGFTYVLTARYPVQCGETYHIKLAIADASDDIYDSGVFLEAGSFSAGQVILSTNISYGSLNDSTLYEGCGQACLVFARTTNLNGTDTANITLGGTATAADYIPQIPSQIIFQPGQDSIVICVQALQDNVSEGLETLILNSTTHGICIQNVDSLRIYLSDFLPINVDAGPDTSLCTSSPITINAAVSGGVEPYSYQWSNSATTPSITVSPTVTTSYIVTVTDPCGSPAGTDTVTVFLPSGNPLTTSPTPDLILCSGDPAMVAVTASGGSQPYGYNWTTIAGPTVLPNPNGNANTFTPAASGTFVVVTHDGCNVFRTDTINVSIHDCNVVPPNVFTPNGDGTNDNLVFFGLDNFPNTSLTIYNRWGNKIYESADYHNDWNGSGVADGTYYYILTENDGTSLTGFLTILK
jgi:gliding motility-associated-like protein